MDFSLLYEMQTADPAPGREHALFHECVEQVVLADALGYRRIWEVEHHGLTRYSHSSCPEVFLSFVAARTRHIRLGHGISLTPGRYNHPIRVAERVGTLDILSGGRVDWGSGKSASRVEQDAFQVDRATLHDEWLEALEMITRIWQSDVFEYAGRFYQVPPTRIIPRPVQKPHPPLFAACSSASSVTTVGELGLGALNFAQGSSAFLKRKIDAYRRAARNAGPRHYRTNNHFACCPTSIVLDDDRNACEHGFRGSRFFGQALARYYYHDDRPLALHVDEAPLSEDELHQAMRSRDAAEAPTLTIIGDPVAARESVARFQELGVDELILIMQMGTVPHDVVMQSIRTFGEKVLPHFSAGMS